MYQGKYRRIIDRNTFELCQEVLHGKNRRVGSPNLQFSGGLLTCAHCGQSITGEKIKRKLINGGVREHVYYRCANNRQGPDHPKLRWRECDLEIAIIKDLQSIRFPNQEIAAWFRQSLTEAFADVATAKQRQLTNLTKRRSELTTMQDRLLNAYLGRTVDETTYAAKAAEIKSDLLTVEESIEKINKIGTVDSELGLRLFDWSQNIATLWLGSNISQKREILDLICLNRTLSDVSLVLVKRKPFEFLFERLSIQSSRGEPDVASVDRNIPVSALNVLKRGRAKLFISSYRGSTPVLPIIVFSVSFMTTRGLPSGVRSLSLSNRGPSGLRRRCAPSDLLPI